MGSFSGNIKRGPKTFSEGGAGFSGNIRTRRPAKGGGSVSGRFFNNLGQPIQVREPKFGFDVGAYRGNIRRGPKTFDQAGAGFSGNIKSRRPPKGGGSVSGRGLNNGGLPIQVREPKFGFDVGAYRGNIRRGPKTFDRAGSDFSGYIKVRRPLKGGGSVSGRLFNNHEQPIQVREPKFGFDVGAYRGNIRRGPKTFSQAGSDFSGYIKTRRPLKGGGSISGRPLNNQGQPIQVREPKFGFDVGAYRGNIRRGPKAFSEAGYDFSGNMKARRPQKGGGSVSGRPLNNGGNPIQVREPKYTFDVGAYPGSIRRGPKAFSTAGSDYSGDIKAKKPEHGGGSVSGKLWNNHNSPINGRAVEALDKAGSRYSGELKLSRFRRNYVQNPNANKRSSQKQRPDKSTFAVDGLQIKSRQFAHGKNKSSAKASIDVRTANRTTVKASEYGGRMKPIWSYKHNPHSSKLAINVRYPGKAVARLKDYQGNQRMSKFRGKDLHPDAQFAHSKRDNVKHERTILVNVKLAWSKWFRKGANQPSAVKEKIRKPRYDKKEKELWIDLYD